MANKNEVKVEKGAVNGSEKIGGYSDGTLTQGENYTVDNDGKVGVDVKPKPDISALAVETKVKPLAGTKVSKLKGDGVYLRNSLTNKIIAGPLTMHLASIQQRDFAHIEIVDKDGKQD